MHVYCKLLDLEKKCRPTAKMFCESHKISCRSEMLYSEITSVRWLFLVIDQKIWMIKIPWKTYLVFRSLGAQ